MRLLGPRIGERAHFHGSDHARRNHEAVTDVQFIAVRHRITFEPGLHKVEIEEIGWRLGSATIRRTVAGAAGWWTPTYRAQIRAARRHGSGAKVANFAVSVEGKVLSRDPSLPRWTCLLFTRIALSRNGTRRTVAPGCATGRQLFSALSRAFVTTATATADCADCNDFSSAFSRRIF